MSTTPLPSLLSTSLFSPITMSFERLPNELIVAILNHLPRDDLPSVSLTNKRLHDLVEPILYSTFTQTGDLASWHFLRTIAEKPHLCRFVRHIHAADNLEELNGSYEVDVVHQAALRNYLPDDLFGIKGYDSDTWLHDLFISRAVKVASWDVAFALLLVLCSSSLETVNFRWYSPRERSVSYPWIVEVLRQAALGGSVSRLLPRLHSVTISGGYVGGESFPASLDSLRSYHMIPSVAHVCACGISDQYAPSERRRIQDYAYNDVNRHITSLSLIDCRIAPNNIRKFLGSFHSLEKLEYIHGGDVLFVDRSVMSESLQNSRDCLQYLVVGSSDGVTNPLGGDEVNYIGSLANFAALKTLDIEMQALFGTHAADWDVTLRDVKAFLDAFPENLESLTLRNCKKSTNGLLNGLFIEERCPPRLQRLEVSKLLSCPLLSL